MRELDNSTEYTNTTFILDAHEHYLRCDPKHRQMAVIWLNGLTEAYKLALHVFTELVDSDESQSEYILNETLYDCFDSDWCKIHHCSHYIRSLVLLLVGQLLPALNSVGVSPNQIRLASIYEEVINEWSYGTVLLKFYHPTRPEVHFSGKSNRNAISHFDNSVRIV